MLEMPLWLFTENWRVPRRREDEGAGGPLSAGGEEPGSGFGSGDGGKEANCGTCFTFLQG